MVTPDARRKVLEEIQASMKYLSDERAKHSVGHGARYATGRSVMMKFYGHA